MAEYIDRKRYMKDKYNCDLLMIEGVELVPLYQIIDRLEQQYCEDAIYRQDAIRLAERGQVQGFEWQIRKLTTLPSVTPTSKKGKWVYTPHKRLVDETDEGPVYEIQEKCSCSACGADFGYCKVDDNYCKYCGSEMGDGKECE